MFEFSVRRGLCGSLFVAIVILAATAPASAIVVSDNPGLHEITAPSGFDMVGKLNSANGTSGVLIDPWYVLTAKHAVNNFLRDNKVITFTIGNVAYTVDNSNSTKHATADLAVLKLTVDTGLSGYGLYDVSTYGTEVGQEGILAGYGVSGIGAPDPATYPKGTNRYGYNEIDDVYTSTESGLVYLQMDFDDPADGGGYDGLGIAKEVIFADGDSGGPTFINDGSGNLLVAGIHVGFGEGENGSYGDTGFDVRVEAYRTWITDQIPEPATLMLIAGGLPLVLGRKRR